MKLDKYNVEKFLQVFAKLYQDSHISKDEATIFALMYIKVKQYIKLEEAGNESPELSDSTIDDFI